MFLLIGLPTSLTATRSGTSTGTSAGALASTSAGAGAYANGQTVRAGRIRNINYARSEIQLHSISESHSIAHRSVD